MDPGSEMLTSPEVSRMLGVSIRTVHRRVEAHELAAAQKLPGPNGAYLFRRSDVEQYLAEHAGAAADDAPAVPAPRSDDDDDEPTVRAGSARGAA